MMQRHYSVTCIFISVILLTIINKWENRKLSHWGLWVDDMKNCIWIDNKLSHWGLQTDNKLSHLGLWIDNKLSHLGLWMDDIIPLNYWHYQLVLSWYLHEPESHQLSLVLSERHLDP